MSDIKSRIEKLRIDLDKYNYNYYILDNPTISDYEFDKLLKELQELENNHPEFYDSNSPSQRVGGQITKNFPTIIHEKRMFSLDNSYSFDDIRNWEKRIYKELGEDEVVEYVCELKYDGLSISLLYENGEFKQGVTRGDGNQGDDVSHNIRTIKSIPLKLKGNYPSRFFIRGEIVLPFEALKKLNEEREKEGLDAYANPRNTASGSLKLQDSKEVAKRGLDCFLYTVISDELAFSNQWDSLHKAGEMGFKVPLYSELCKNIEEIENFINYWDKERFNLPFETDGVVIKVNSILQQEELGFTSKYPKWAIAYKFKTEKVETKLLSIDFQVGRIGTITPVGNLKPVQLGGTTVKRASLHNEDIIKNLDLRVGDYVFVEKGGEIIPKIVDVNYDKREKNLQKFEFIKNCTECNTPLVRREGEAAHICPNEDDCPPQVIGRLEHFVSRKAMNIDSIGGETASLLFKEGLVRNISDFYSLKEEQISGLERMGKKSAKNIITGIELSKQISFERVLYAIGIKHIGETVAKKLAKKFKSLENIKNASFEELIETEDIGEKIAQSIKEYFNKEEHIKIIEELKSMNVQFEYEDINIPISNFLEGKTFLFTGKLTKFTRDEAENMVELHGGKNISGVSKNLNYLIAGEKAGSKLKKAEQIGTVNILTEDEFLDLLK